MKIHKTELLENKTIAIVGSRNFQNLHLVKNFVEALPKTVKIVSGGANGVDSVAIEMARRNKLTHEVFYPEEKTSEKYLKRNRQIVRAADIVVIFWDGVSTGSEYVKNFCEKVRKEHMVVLENGEDFHFKATWPEHMYRTEE